MVKVCEVCKKFWNGVEDRSFHIKKWIEVLGLEEAKVNKYCYVCSDHFDINCFSVNTTVRRLIVDSVPFSSITSEYEIPTPQTTISHVQSGTENICINKSKIKGFHKELPSGSIALPSLIPASSSTLKAPPDKIIAINKKIINEDIFIYESDYANSKSPSIADPNFQQTVLRGGVEKKEQEEEPYVAKGRRVRKKLRRRRCWQNSSTYLPRKLFINDNAYESFVKYASFQQKAIRDRVTNMRHKLNRRQKKIDRLEATADKMKKEKKKSVVKEYQELPPLIDEMLNRIKNNKQKTPYSPFMQAFAKSIHVFSAATYEIIRTKYLSCLPHPNGLTNWKKSQLKNLQKEFHATPAISEFQQK